MRGFRIAGVAVLFLTLAGLALGITGTGIPATSRASSGAPVLRVSERDFEINAPRTVAPGFVRLHVANHGPDTHELIVVRSDARRLPLRLDGLTVDENAVGSDEAGIAEAVAPGRSGEMRLHLRPGRYVFFCNMSGHYRGGMHTVVEVRG